MINNLCVSNTHGAVLDHSLVGGGGPVLAVIIPGSVLVQHLRPVRRPRHDVQPVAGLQRVLAPRPRLMLRLQERGGRLDAEQGAGAHEDWRDGKKGARKGRGERRKMGAMHELRAA